MATLKQFQANRRNAQKSTGPKTPEGKAAVSMNALRHGLRARTVVLPGENREEFTQLCDDLEVEWSPESRTEQFCGRGKYLQGYQRPRKADPPARPPVASRVPPGALLCPSATRAAASTDLTPRTGPTARRARCYRGGAAGFARRASGSSAQRHTAGAKKRQS